MYLEQHLMISLWPTGKKCGLESITCKFVPGLTTIPKMLINISSVKPILMKKRTGSTSQFCNYYVHIVKGTQTWER